MRKVKVEQLTHEAYAPFGTFANLINPNAFKLGEKPVEFFRDMAQVDVSPNALLSYSTVRVEKREMVIDILESHSTCSEVLLPIDNDMLLQIAPASAPGEVPLEYLRVFFVPKGTVITIRPGMWHWAPFTLNDEPANVMVNLPERAYANDCDVIELEEKDRIEIEM